jgi:uncharacterized membrane protein (DUF485 family)
LVATHPGSRALERTSDQRFRLALAVAFVVVLVELGVITWIRHRYMDTPTVSAALQVALGGALVFVTGVLIGSS